MGWEKITIGTHFETGSGGTPLSSMPEYYDGGNIPWINSGELNAPFINSTHNYITEAGKNNSSAKLFPKDSVLVAMYGATAGKCSLLEIEATTNQAICAILPSQNHSPHFIKYAIDNLYAFLKSSSSGSARDNISQDFIKNLVLFCPKGKEKQESLITILSLIDRKIALNREINRNLPLSA